MFPPLFIILGVAAIGLSIYLSVFSVEYSNLHEEYQQLVGALGFGLIGLVPVTFRGRFQVENETMQILKEYRAFGFLLSREKVKIPGNATHVIIQQKTKQGRGYVQAVVGFGYTVHSSDVYFATRKGAIPIIKTDLKRALKIAGILKENLQIDYSIQ